MKQRVLAIIVDMLADLGFNNDEENRDSLLISVNKLIELFDITKEEISEEEETR